MGQLERYGLYVLVIVIFLILGVAIWGGDPIDAQPKTLVSPDSSLGKRIDDPDSSDRFKQYFVGPLFDEIPGRDKAPPIPGPGDLGSQQPVDVVDVQPPLPSQPPFQAAVRAHTIALGDTLGGLSQTYYGTTTKWQAIQDANPGINERTMPIGKSIVIPDLGQGGPAVVDSGRTYIVRLGDSPARISKRYFNTEKYADLIMKSNGIKDARKLSIGTVLRIPVRPADG